MKNFNAKKVTPYIDTALLACLKAVADHGGFTSAGAALGLTQSAVSVRIKKLEDDLGTRLVMRARRGAQLTADGLRIMRYASGILDLNEQMINEVRSQRLTGRLRLGVADYVVPTRLPQILAQLKMSFPDLSLDLTSGLGLDLIPLLEAERLDILIAGSNESSRFKGHPLGREPLVWAVSDQFQLEEAALPLAALPDPCSHRKAAADALTRAGHDFEIRYTSRSISGILALVEAGLAVAAVPGSALGRAQNPLVSKLGLPGLGMTDLALYHTPRITPGERATLMRYFGVTTTNV